MYAIVAITALILLVQRTGTCSNRGKVNMVLAHPFFSLFPTPQTSHTGHDFIIRNKQSFRFNQLAGLRLDAVCNYSEALMMSLVDSALALPSLLCFPA